MNFQRRNYGVTINGVYTGLLAFADDIALITTGF